MKIFVAIDNTDNIESRGTSELAEMLSKTLARKGWGKGGAVTRHQMLIHPDIPYTSHNSAMCFIADMHKTMLDEFICFAQDFLANESTTGSAPGLCVADHSGNEITRKLMDFGLSAKERVLEKKDAYNLARILNVHLSEHGGTGQGIIGALAGVGLRMIGNDSRFKGHFKIKPPGALISVGDLKKTSGVGVVKSLEGQMLDDEEMVILGEKVKAVLLENRSTMLVYEAGNGHVFAKWHTCTKQQLRKY